MQRRQRIRWTAARRALLVALAVGALAVPASASAWQIEGAKFFAISGTRAQDYKITIKKCSGGKLGIYKLRYDHFLLIQDKKDDLYLRLDMRVRFPITTVFKHTQVEKFELTYSQNFSDDAANEIHDDLVPFYNSQIKVKATADASHVIVHHGPLFIGSNEVLEPGTKKTAFNPKPGC